MTLPPRNKNIMLGMLCFVIIAGVLLVIMPVFLKPQFDPETANKLRYSGENLLVITPRFTESAYGEHGFYNYYDHTCGMECLTIPIQNGRPDRWGSYNLDTVQALSSLGYPMLDDVSLHKKLLANPDYLNQYDTIILLHSEYVTKELYQAITAHKHVIYLAPNALYAEIAYFDTDDGPRMSLVRGHGYPTKDISNGFGWKDDNSKEEYDIDCNIWKFRNVTNGEQLTCAPRMSNPAKIVILLKMKELITP